MYLRIEIYDGELKYHYDDNGEKERACNGVIGYYNDDDYEMATAFNPYINLYETSETEFYQNNYMVEKYGDFTGYQRYLDSFRNYFYEEGFVKLNNDYISSECEVPTLVQFIAVCDSSEGKNMVKFVGQYYNGDTNGLITISNVLKTDKAIALIEANNNKNNKIRNMSEKKINDIIVSEDSKEYVDIVKPVAVKVEETKPAVVEKVPKNDIDYTFVIILSSLGIGIVICIIIIVIDVKKKRYY